MTFLKKLFRVRTAPEKPSNLHSQAPCYSHSFPPWTGPPRCCSSEPAARGIRARVRDTSLGCSPLPLRNTRPTRWRARNGASDSFYTRLPDCSPSPAATAMCSFDRRTWTERFPRRNSALSKTRPPPLPSSGRKFAPTRRRPAPEDGRTREPWPPCLLLAGGGLAIGGELFDPGTKMAERRDRAPLAEVSGRK